jgi:hypothetical protein
MDIGSGNGYPSGALSNFSPHPFVFDGVECNSMEGLLQSFKFDKEHVQAEICKLVGKAAKFRGKKRNRAWKSVQKLWWKGVAMDRHGPEYQSLLDRAHHRGGIRDIPYYCAVCTTSNSVTGVSKHITCESARVLADQCGPSGKRWKARRGLISCQG